MKFKHLAILLALTVSLTSCFKKEEPNAECDITEAILPIAKKDVDKVFYNPADSVVKVSYADNEIVFKVKRGTDISKLSPKFVITKGAKITPENGSVQDFTKGKIKYTVTSESGAWTREYFVSISSAAVMVDEVKTFEFENYELEPKEKKYYVWQDSLSNGEIGKIWDNGNLGFSISNGDAKPEDYPTAPLLEGYKGAALSLTTLSTGPLGAMFGAPIAAGNMFLGNFVFGINPLKTTHFGIPFDKKPVKLSGYYQYKPGEKYTDKKMNVIEGKIDEPDIYAVFYTREFKPGEKAEEIFLDGSNVKTSDRIVAIAQLDNFPPTDKWTKFEIPFVYKSEVDLDMLAQQKYNLAIVFSSSKGGASFMGAVGSNLKIDSIELDCKQEKL